MSLLLLFVALTARDGGIGIYLFPIAHEEALHMTKTMAALLITIYHLFLTAGRGFGALFLQWVPIKIFLFAQLCLATCTQLLLYFYGLKSNASLWILTSFFAVLSGPTYPSLMCWADCYIDASGVAIAVIDIGIGLGGFLTLWLYAHAYNVLGSAGVFLLILLFSAVMFLLLTPLQIVSAIHGDRYKKNCIEEDTVDALPKQLNEDNDSQKSFKGERTPLVHK